MLVITKLDRLAGSMSDLQDISKTLDQKGVNFIMLDQSIKHAAAMPKDTENYPFICDVIDQLKIG